MKYQKVCECCWEKVVWYTHKLNKWLISWLDQLVRFYKKNHTWANLQRDLDLSINIYNNFQKLQYFTLIKKDKWGRIPTDFWIRFIEWSIPCYTTVATLWKNIIRFDHPARQTVKELPTKKFIREFDWQYSYKKREEYQLERGFRTPTLFW